MKKYSGIGAAFLLTLFIIGCEQISDGNFWDVVGGYRDGTPRSVSATAMKDGSIEITWKGVEKARSYQIYYDNSPEGKYGHLATVYDTRYTDRSISPEETRYYKVCAYSDTGSGAMSEYAWAISSPTYYTITYYTNGATGTPPAAQTVPYGTAITVAEKGTLNYPGKTFTGWNTASLGIGTVYAARASFQVYSNVTLYAQWQTQNPGTTYTVTYDANGATGTPPAAQTGTYESYITVAGKGILAYPGKTFTGWNTESSGLGLIYAAGYPLTVYADITLYAQWETATPGKATVPVTINDPVQGEDVVLSPLTSLSIQKGSEETFSVSGVSGSYYQWYLNGSFYGGTSDTYYTLYTDSLAEGVYELMVVVRTNTGTRSGSCRINITN
jgi:uncharacterized repeat protein (TIGR02543 family)